MELLLFIWFTSPIISIILFVAYLIEHSDKKRLQNDIKYLSDVINKHKDIFSNEDDLKEFLSDDNENAYNSNTTQIDTINDNNLSSNNSLNDDAKIYNANVEQNENKYKTDNVISNKNEYAETSIKPFIITSRINVAFGLGILFITIAGIIFATTTWKIIPNIFKIIILIIVSGILLLLSLYAKNKLKLNKTSITFYILFSIILSIIPISLGYFKMLGNNIIIGGNNEFILYAISLLILTISFGSGSRLFSLDIVSKNLLYVSNIELLLVTLNFTKSLYIILLILSIFNFINLLISYLINIKKSIWTELFDDIYTNNIYLLTFILSISMLLNPINLYFIITSVFIYLSLALISIKTRNIISIIFKSIFYILVIYKAYCSEVISISHINNVIVLIVLVVSYIILTILNEKFIKNRFSNLIAYNIYKIAIGVLIIINIISYRTLIVFDEWAYLIIFNIALLLFVINNIFIRINYKNSIKENTYIDEFIYIIIYIISFINIQLPWHYTILIPLFILVIGLFVYIVFNVTDIKPIIPFIMSLVLVDYMWYVVSGSQLIHCLVLVLITHIILFLFNEYLALKNVKMKNTDILIMLVSSLSVISLYYPRENFIYGFVFILLAIFISIYANIKYDIKITNILSIYLLYIIYMVIAKNLILIRHGLYYMILSLRWSAVILIFINLISLFSLKLKNINKKIFNNINFINLYIFIYLILSFVLNFYNHNEIYISQVELKIKNVYLLLYLLLPLFINKINLLNDEKDFYKNVIPYQFVILEFLIVRELYNLRNITSFINTDYDILYFTVFISFMIYIIYKLVIKKLSKKYDLINCLDIVYNDIFPRLLYVFYIIIYVYSIHILYSIYKYDAFINAINIKIFIDILMLFITSHFMKNNIISLLLVLLLPYLYVNLYIEKNITYLIFMVMIFIIYFIISLSVKSDNKIINYKYKNISINYFAISNIMFIIYYLKGYILDALLYEERFKNIINILYYNHNTVFLIIVSLYVYQFIKANNEKKYQNNIKAISLTFIFFALIIQKFINIPIYYQVEYIIFLIYIYVFILDKIVYRFDKELSRKLWFIILSTTGVILYYRVIIYNSVIKSIMYGVFAFIIFILSFVLKDFKKFTLSTIMMVLLIINETRDFFTNIPWWVYLLVVGILLIVFATKNEMLKKQNTNMLKVINKHINNIKNYIEKK